MTAEQEQALMGDSVKQISRWHDVARGTGVAIYETDDAAALTRYSLAWNEFMDLDTSVVLDDDETRAVSKS